MSSRHRPLTGDTVEEADKVSPDKTVSLPIAVVSQKPNNSLAREDDAVEESMDDENGDSEDGSLMIADMHEGKDTDDTDKESGHSDEEEEQGQLVFNGTMTRRQSKQFQDSGGNFAVFSVRPGGKSKNRTCEYCGVLKATPAALIRHIRKHTGEKPFVCQLCSKAYKAKRSLHMHQNSHHRELGQMLPPNPSSLPTQVPITSPVLMQTSPTPAISEATKSLLRETLESSRKARDGVQLSDSFVGTAGSSRVSERLPTPNLVNLLTSDISKKMQNVDEPICLAKGAINLSKDATDISTNYINITLPVIKQEKMEEKFENEVEEEQAQDLSMPTMQKSAYVRHTPPEKRIKCELCNKSFKHDISRTNHMRTAHNIIVSVSGTQLSKQLDPFKLAEQKPGLSTATLPHHAKLELAYHKQDLPTDLSISPLHSHKLMDSSRGHLLQDVFKMESPLASNPDASVLDDSDTLPYNVTSRMVQDFDVEKLIIKGIEKSVLAEDGGNRRVRMTTSRETVLVTRLDGINNITGRQATVFKCHLCSRVFTSMLRYHHHLPSHFDAEVQTFDCRYCEAAFRSLSQIVKHLQCHREKFTGLNQSGTGLNSSALLLEEFHRKQKLEPHAAGNMTSGSPANLFSPNMYSDESLSGTPQLEPGERVNGGYTCVKCRKSFSREYLLQRHMRIHQNQNMFYCPECENGFSGEMDMLEHRRKVHDVKVTEQLQFSSLLKNISELKQKLTARQAFVSDRNNNTSDASLLGSNVFPLVDIKAFDLRKGEAVEVKMSSDLSSSIRGDLSNEKARKAIAAANTGELHKRKLQAERISQEANEEAKKTEEVAKRRKIEHEKLRQKLAQEGMGDVTVVLPDAPPPDADSVMERPTDLSVLSEPPSGVGFMARKTSPKSALTSAPVDHVEYKAQDSGKQESETARNLLASGVKQPPADKTDPHPGPSSKSRRKAHKPQKINNRPNKIDHIQTKISEDNNNNKTTTTSSLYQHSLAGIYQQLTGSEFMAQEVLSRLMGNGGGIHSDSNVEQKKLSAIDFSKNATPTVVNAASVSKVTPAGCEAEDSSSRFGNSGAIDLTTESKDPHAKLSATALLYQASRKVASSSSSSSLSASSPPLGEGPSKLEFKRRGMSLPVLTRGISNDSTALDSENSRSQEATPATDLSKTSLLTVQIPASQEGLISCSQVLWNPGNPWPAELSESLLGAIQAGQWNGKGKSSSYAGRSRNSSPSPVPSPTSSDTSSTAESRKITTTSLSRTHSRLSIVNEPLDRNSLCKPQVLDDGRSVYTCVICHKQFLSLSDINRHMDFHEDIRPYKCKYCDYYARTNSQLKVHKLRHEGVREFCCRVCNYKGVTQSDLNRHMKSQVHLLRSNHVCSQCGEGFVTPKTLRDHVCCTGSGDKSFENCSANEIDDDANNDEYEEEESVNCDTR